MKNIDFLKNILMSDAEYWIVAQEVTSLEYGKYVRCKDNVILLSIPKGIKRGLKYEEVTLQELEKLRNCFCEENIYLNTDYPPFQQFLSFYDIYVGFPVEKEVRKFMLDALALHSDKILDYKRLISPK